MRLTINIIAAFIAFLPWLYGQDKGYMTIRGYVNLHSKPLEAVTVTLFKNGVKTAQEVTKSNGKFTFTELPLTIKDDEYIMELTKPGHVTLKHFISTRVPPDFTTAYPTYIPTIELFETVPGLDKELTAILEKPVSRFAFNPEKNDFYDDKAYFNSIRAKVEQLFAILRAEAEDRYRLIADYRKKKMEEEKKRAEAETRYKETISKADALFNNKDYVNSKALYLQAHAVLPDETYARDRIDEIDKLLAAMASEEAIRSEALKEVAEKNAMDSEEKSTQTEANKVLKNEEEKKLAAVTTGKKAELERKRIEAQMHAAQEQLKKENITKSAMEYEAMKSRKAELKTGEQKQIQSSNMRNLMLSAAENERNNKMDEWKEKPASKKVYKPSGTTKFPRYEYIPKVQLTTSQTLFSTTKNIIVYYPTRRDTLQSVRYLWGGETFYKNGKEIPKESYANELQRLSLNR